MCSFRGTMTKDTVLDGASIDALRDRSAHRDGEPVDDGKAAMRSTLENRTDQHGELEAPEFLQHVKRRQAIGNAHRCGFEHMDFVCDPRVIEASAASNALLERQVRQAMQYSAADAVLPMPISPSSSALVPALIAALASCPPAAMPRSHCSYVIAGS